MREDSGGRARGEGLSGAGAAGRVAATPRRRSKAATPRSRTGASTPRPESADALAAYLRAISRHGILDRQQEGELARRYRAGDLDAGHRLVTANLRFVVKVAYEYRNYGLRMEDLIQEGNIGLVKAVEKFDPDRGIRLISYAVWWIRAYAQNYILHNWSLVKLGTTQAQRRLFFSLARTRRELQRLDPGGEVATDLIAAKLRVRPVEVVQMQQRLHGHDLSLDAPLGGDSGDEAPGTHLDFLEGHGRAADDELGERELARQTVRKVHEALSRLDPRERYIIEQRLLVDEPVTLKELGRRFGFSRERARQLETRARERLRHALAGHAASLHPGDSGAD